MTPDELARDRLERVLLALPRQEPRAEPAARLRSKCREHLAKRVHARPALTTTPTSRRRLLADAAMALAGALGVLYLATVVGRALSFYGF